MATPFDKEKSTTPFTVRKMQSWALAHFFEVRYPLPTQFVFPGLLTLMRSFFEFPFLLVAPTLVAPTLVAQPVDR
jgi:hypothetical protein